jgi:ATP-dependent helicase HrpB
MTFNPFTIALPITEVIPDVKQHLISNNTLIVNAPPGAGKSTLLPLALLQEKWLEGKKILMLEPRRLAARTIAERMASLIGEEVGKTVGYRIRFENRVSANTIIEVLTEGILTRMLHSDNALKEAALVIFDEFHERSIYADVALALCREAQKTLRPDLRIMIMSATLNMPQLTQLLKAPVVKSEGKQYPVEIHYVGEQDEMLLPEMTARTVVKAVREKEGDTLVFLPGEREIKKCEEILRKELRDFVIRPLYGQLPQGKQYSAIMPDKQGKRKIVLATSIAETSLTIEGIKIVVDSGFGRTSKFDPKSGLSRLQTITISKDSADQRAGRAGRLSAGTCYRMWSPKTQERMAEHRTPEILETDLSSLVLDMAQWGVMNLEQLTWLTPPPKSALTEARDLLHQLDALENGRITSHGKKIHELPCHPRIGHMLLMAQHDERLALATDIAALVEERDPLTREAGIDINLRIVLLRRFRKEKGQNKKLIRIDKIAGSYRKLFNITEENNTIDPYETGVLLAHAYPERIAYARPGNNAQFQLANGKYAMASHKDELAHEPWLAIAHADAREGMGKIFMASPLNPKDLAPLVKTKDVITWDTDTGELKATRDLRIGNIILKSKPLPPPDIKHLPIAISDALKIEGEDLLNWDEEVTQWQNRVLSLRKWRPDEGWPDVSTATLLMTNSEWLSPFIKDIEEPENLKNINLIKALNILLDRDKQELLEVLAPGHLEINGKKYALTYTEAGEPPSINGNVTNATKINFINEGKTPVLNVKQ